MNDASERTERLATEGADYARRLAPGATWSSYTGSGVLGWTMPVAAGGSGRDFSGLVAWLEGLGYGGGDAGVLFAIAAQILSVQHPIAKFGTEAQQQALLPRLIAGELRAAHAATEPESGSDVFDVRTTAVGERGGYRVNGVKCYITSAPVADLALVLASTDRERGAWGLTAFLVDLESDGVTRGDNVPKMGLRSAEFGEIRFQDCFVPADRRLGAEGNGRAIFDHALDLERAFIMAPALGSMRQQLEHTVAEANRRQRRGHSIGSFQSVSNRVADMSLRLELSRLRMYRAAALRDAGRSTRLLSPLVKLAVSEHFVASSLDAFRIHGASGYLLDSAPEATLRDALGGLSYSGTSDVLRTIVAQQAGLTRA
jgi:alkylation response protein AidB-like acyl-CoA dehydrogenase